MKNFLTCLLILLVAGSSFGQTTLRGVVRDQNNVGVFYKLLYS
ncbi:MAG: hypothetical protein AAF391_07800 [Bacteroidota bacterium]